MAAGLRVLGAGFSRTGTMSLKRGLERLGFGPCYHMDEVFRRPEHVPRWREALRREPDWPALFAGYGSAADGPVCHFWRGIRAAFPGIPVVLTVRDAQAWYESYRSTVYEILSHPERLGSDERAALEMARELDLDHTFGGRFEDRAHALAVYERHNAAVKAAVPAAELLVYDVAQGWEPLCGFLGVPVPDEPFPNINTRGAFRSRIGLS